MAAPEEEVIPSSDFEEENYFSEIKIMETTVHHLFLLILIQKTLVRIIMILETNMTKLTGQIHTDYLNQQM